MWLFTKEGFFSVVHDQYCNRGELMIRSRRKDDLCLLSKKLHGYCDESNILELSETDYRYRMKVPKHAWAEYLSDCALNLEYPDVRENIVPPGDDARKEAYQKIWELLHRWQS